MIITIHRLKNLQITDHRDLYLYFTQPAVSLYYVWYINNHLLANLGGVSSDFVNHILCNDKIRSSAK